MENTIMNNLINEVTEKLNSDEKKACLVVQIECDNIQLSNSHDFDIYDLYETKDKIVFDSLERPTFSIGKNFLDITYDTEEYVIRYNNNIIITIAIF